MRRLTSTAIATALGATALLVPATAAHADEYEPIQTDIGVTAVGPDSATPGEWVTYTLKVTNWGNSAASSIVRLALPTGTTDATYEERPVVTSQVLVNNLPPGETDTLKITANIGSHGNAKKLPASFRVSPGEGDFPLYRDTNPSNDTANIVTENTKEVVGARLSLKGVIRGAQWVGRTHLQKVTITNTGDRPTHEFRLRGSMHPKSKGIVHVKGVQGANGSFHAAGLNYSFPALKPGASRVITLAIRTVKQPGGFGGKYQVGGGRAPLAELDLRG
ncbi:hypothetical protein [Streptomyces sp. NPDC059816]|uniref:hypothetical protein n=1 Tax=Streptomyces sp. NPDC059816 TaxID=3346960 RepID=UPI0036522212